MPVFITQPSVLGNAIDSVTGTNLANLKIDDYNGEIYWSMLEQYNSALREVCRETGSPFIDLADSMPKNTSYYYDYFHFTNQGSQMVANIILTQLPKMIITERKKLEPQVKN